MELMSLSMKVFNKLKNIYLLCTLNDCNELASSCPLPNRNNYVVINFKNYFLGAWCRWAIAWVILFGKNLFSRPNIMCSRAIWGSYCSLGSVGT